MRMAIVKRVVREKRAVVVPLVVAAALNAALYLIVVLPLSTRVAAADERVRASEAAQQAAERDYQHARAAAEGKALAQKELERFYRDILPPDQAGARRITYRKLAELAQQAKLAFTRREQLPGRDKDSALAKLTITMVLEGQYENVKRFVHTLETSPEFMVIDHVALAESMDSGGSLVLTIEVATYFRSDDESRLPNPESGQRSPGA